MESTEDRGVQSRDELTNDEARRLALDGAAAAAGVRLTAPQVRTFLQYLELILQWKPRVGLTAHRFPAEIIEIDFGDALAALAVGIALHSSVVDVGSGAGFPGIPLRIARPDLKVTLLEANKRKAGFLELVAQELTLDLRVEPEEAEIAGHRADLRETFDVAITRALGPLAVACELTLPFVRRGGKGVFLKGPHVVTEQPAAARSAKVLGGGELEVLKRTGSSERVIAIVVVPKIGPTPIRFPRRPGVPRRKPIGEA